LLSLARGEPKVTPCCWMIKACFTAVPGDTWMFFKWKVKSNDITLPSFCGSYCIDVFMCTTQKVRRPNKAKEGSEFWTAKNSKRGRNTFSVIVIPSHWGFLVGTGVSPLWNYLHFLLHVCPIRLKVGDQIVQPVGYSELRICKDVRLLHFFALYLAYCFFGVLWPFRFTWN